MLRIYRLIVWGSLLAGGLAVCSPAMAQRSGQQPEVFEGVGIDQRLGAYLPQALTFSDEHGQDVDLETYFDEERPVLLTLVYHDCPMLCSVLLDKLTTTLRDLAWAPGVEFELLTISFNALETLELAARQKARYVDRLGNPDAAAGWHFLTGDTTAIARLTTAVGFNYRWVEAQNEYAHPATLIFVSGDGKITRYLPGLTFPVRDVRAALVEASEGTVGSALDQVFLYCFRYDPQANSYVPHALNIMKIGGLLTMLALGAMLFVFWQREGRKGRGALKFEN